MLRERTMRASENTSSMTARSWLVSDALPLWAETGFDQNRNAFHERLTLDGIPIHDVPRRLMVQSRQIYSYATVAQHNWIEGANDLVAIAARSMVRDYYEADSRPGWVMSVDSHRCVVEARRDFYGHSFVLFGLAAAFQATGDDRYLTLADNTLVFLDSMMAHPGGGFIPYFRTPAEPSHAPLRSTLGLIRHRKEG